MHRLNVAMPGVFVGMHHIKTVAGQPPCAGGKPQLIDPPGFAHGHGDPVISDTRPLMGYLLGENMDVMPGSELFDQSNRIALSPTAGCRESPIENSNPKSFELVN